MTSLIISPEIVLSNLALLQLFELTNLTCLELNGENLSTAGASKLANLTLLECLKITRSHQIIEENMINLFSKLNNLKTVDISGISFSSQGVTTKSLSVLVNNNPNLC